MLAFPRPSTTTMTDTLRALAFRLRLRDQVDEAVAQSA
jgi:hypothetical protein